MWIVTWVCVTKLEVTWKPPSSSGILRREFSVKEVFLLRPRLRASEPLGFTTMAKDALGGKGDATHCAGVGFGAIRAGSFLPVKAAGGCKTVARAYFRGRGVCTQYDPKIILGAKS